jgi:hypothetical protein
MKLWIQRGYFFIICEINSPKSRLRKKWKRSHKGLSLISLLVWSETVLPKTHVLSSFSSSLGGSSFHSHLSYLPMRHCHLFLYLVWFCRTSISEGRRKLVLYVVAFLSSKGKSLLHVPKYPVWCHHVLLFLVIANSPYFSQNIKAIFHSLITSFAVAK